MVVVPMAAVPLSLGWLLRVRHPDFANILGSVGTVEGITGVTFLLVAIAAVAILGAYVIHRHRADQATAAVGGMYDLIEKIGSGGMGEVWLAKHHVLARPAAIKLIRAELLGDGETEAKRRALRRFEREAQATAALRSPHTIELYDFGLSHAGVFFYVMEYLDGLDLSTLIERFGPVPIERAVHYLIQACDSLSDAHNNNLIHRDIKPANIHACRMGTNYDYVKVLDFGLAKSVIDQATSTEVTIEGTATGTPAYMAPEMATGSQRADARSDVYALGCVAYYLVTGRPPFEANSPVALLVEQINAIPSPPSKRSEVPIPEELDRIILKCLEKDPADRFQTANELAVALSACPLPEAWTNARAEDWWRKHLPTKQPAAA
jgi:serine/threonine-protein kinase